MESELVYYDAEKDMIFTVVHTSPRALFIHDLSGPHFFWGQDKTEISKHLSQDHIISLGEL
jgi:hypothetical protein